MSSPTNNLNESSATGIPNGSKKPAWLKILRLVIAISVAIALMITIRNAVSNLREQDFDFTNLRWSYLAISVAAYSLAMLLSAVFWRMVLAAMGCRPTWLSSVRAFLISQLGKYLPGKAMVVIIRTDMIRTDMIRSKDNDTVAVVASVFAETLTWIFVGGVIACVLIFLEFHDQTALRFTAGLFVLITGFVTFPPVFRKLASRIGKRDMQSFDGLTFSTLACGWLLLSIGWCFNGLSLWMVLQSFPDLEITWTDYRLTLACVSLATVAGFASLLPGGLGVRELVMIPLLGPRFGMGIAVMAAILIRLVWLFSELACGAIIYGFGRNSSHGSSTAEFDSHR